MELSAKKRSKKSLPGRNELVLGIRSSILVIELTSFYLVFTRLK